MISSVEHLPSSCRVWCLRLVSLPRKKRTGLIHTTKSAEWNGPKANPVPLRDRSRPSTDRLGTPMFQCKNARKAPPSAPSIHWSAGYDQSWTFIAWPQ
jgi:hypothetical protein